jgi:hypothetical protein
MKRSYEFLSSDVFVTTVIVKGPSISIYKVNQSLDRLSGLQEFEVPKFQEIWHGKVVRLSVLRTGRIYPQDISLCSFLLESQSMAGSSATGST